MMKVLSPYVLLQEILWPDRWKSTVACLLLNRTKRAQVDKVWPKLFEKYPDAKSLLEANDEELRAILQPLGLSKMRSGRLKKLAQGWISGVPFQQLHGVGEYAMHSDQIFYNNILPDNVSDHALVSYVKWKKEQEQ